MTLTFDCLTLNVLSRSDITWSNHVSNFSEIKQFPAELLTIYLFSRANFDQTLTSNFYSSERVRPNCAKFEFIIAAPDAKLWCRLAIRFEMRAVQRRVVSKIEAKFQTFDPVNEGRDGKNVKQDDRVDPTTEHVVYI